MTNDSPEPTKLVVQVVQGREEPLPQVYKDSNTGDMNQPHLSNPPETPTPPPCGTNGTRAPEPMTLPERHQAALCHIHTLETHNVKLYEDNCRLVNAVNMLNDRLTFLGAPQNAQVLRFADMQERLRASDVNWALINRKYQDLLQCVSAGSTQYHISTELQAIRDAYTSLEREYHLLGDKYVRLKAIVDTNRVPQPHPQSIGECNPLLSDIDTEGYGPASGPHAPRGLAPVMRSEFRAHDPNYATSPTSMIPPDSVQPLLDQRRDHQRRSSESAMAQPSVRPATTPIATTCLASLPTPPPSAPLRVGQISPTGFPVHAQVPAASLPLLHHAPMVHGPRKISGLPAVTLLRHPVEQSAPEQPKAIIQLRQRTGETAGTANNEPTSFNKQNPPLTPLKSSPSLPKRPGSEIRTSASPEGERKKPRIEGEAHRPTIIDADAHPANKILSPCASTDPQSDHKVPGSGSDVLSYQDCVNLIFEKDADVENGVFCGLCLDRYEAKMILEPPDILIHPDFDFLIKHCTTMHPTVWDDLRRKT